MTASKIVNAQDVASRGEEKCIQSSGWKTGSNETFLGSAGRGDDDEK